MRTSITLAAALSLASTSLAGITPESVVVVVNGDSWASLTVANEYAHLRHIPASNFIVLTNLSTFDSTDVERFRSEILRPVFKAIADRNLTAQIDCITYSLDIPCSVAVSADMEGKVFGQTITPVASANGLTYLHEWTLKKDPDYLRLDINRYARRTLPLASGTPLSAKEQAEYQRGMKLYDEKKYTEAAAAIRSLMMVKRNDPSMLYNLACCLALSGKGDDAIATLTEAMAVGWRNHGQTTSDPDFASLKDRPDFKALVARMKEAKAEIQPTRGFSSRHGWTEAGEPSATALATPAHDAPRYMLSTMLGVTSGRGNSVGEVLECLRRAAAADGTAPRGTIYFEKNGDVRSSTREWAFPFAGDELKKLGVNATTEDGVLPKSKKDIAGAVIGIADFKWSDSQSTILPGAIVEHLTSCGGMMGERDTQSPCTDFIRAGAAGSSGAVTEPYALQEKFPDAFMHLHYARGSTLAEAFYQSLRGPYQLLIIGDPLCKPWTAKGGSGGGRATLTGVSKATPVKGTISLKPSADSSAWGGLSRFDLFVDGVQTSTTTPGSTFTFDSTPFSDGEHTLTVVGVHKDLMESRSRGEISIRIANFDRAVKINRKPAASVVYGQKAILELECPGAAGFEVQHLGRNVARADTEKVTIEVDTTFLGLGHITLTPVATGRGQSDRVIGPSIEFDVTPPAAIAPKASGPTTGLAKGLSVRIAGGAPTVVVDTIDPAWIATVGANAGKTFVAQGTFDVPASAPHTAGAPQVARPDFFQIQLRTNTGATIELDGVKLLTSTTDSWSYAPARLTPGRHSLRISGTAPATEPARLDLRMGSAGTQHPSDRNFLAAPAEK